VKVTSFKIYRYALPLKFPIVIRGRSQMRLREGIILSLTLDNQWQGFGEIAPLQGLEGGEIEECLNNLKEFAKGLTVQEFPDELDGLFRQIDLCPLIPEARFGLETALYSAIARKLQKPLSYFWGKSPSSAIMVNGLLQEEEPLGQAVNDLLRKGFQSIKVKAIGAVKKDVERVGAVLKLLNNRARIHLDVNQRWSYDDALYFASVIDPKQIEYLEEPFQDIERASEFFRKTGIALALDESLLGEKAATIREGVKAWVVKPTLRGGIRKALAMAGEAKKSGIQMVVSSSFESGIGLCSLIHLTAAINGNCRAGIDTSKYFEKDLLKEPFLIQEGKMAVPNKPLSEGDIRFESLKIYADSVSGKNKRA